MNWISNATEFQSVLLEAHRCVFIDSCRLPTTLTKLVFDDAELCTRRFAELLQSLQARSGDQFVWYVVLNPDPEHYFHRLFGSYPLLKLEREISGGEYLNLLNETPEGNPVDSLGTNWSEAMLLPSTNGWFIHMLRSADDNGGHLWIPSEWKEDIVTRYPFFR